MLTHIQATHHGNVMTPCFHATLPFLMPISPMLVPHSQHHLQDTTYLLLWETVRRGTDENQPTYTSSPLSFLLAERMGGKGRTVAIPGTPQSKPCVAGIKVCTLAHSPAYFPKVTVPRANEWNPSASSVLNQVRLVRGTQFNSI